MSCDTQPIPTGWRVFRGDVPTPLVQFAVDVRDHITSYPLGSIAKTIVYNGQTIGAFCSWHCWTYRNGVLVTGIHIRGVSLIVQQVGGGVGTVQDNLDTPDPTAAVYGADDVSQAISWPRVAATGAAALGVVALFLLALKHAGKAARRSKR
jgi:hypothetical protein